MKQSSLQSGVARLENAIVTLSGPALATSGVIAGVDILTTISQHAMRLVQIVATCWGEVFDRRAAEQLAAAAFERLVQARLGSHYLLAGAVRLAAVQVIAQDSERGTLTLGVLASGIWVYQVDRIALEQLLVGGQQHDALELLAHVPGIQHASISGWNAPLLPADPKQIQIVVITPRLL